MNGDSASTNTEDVGVADFDVVIVGAGFGGLALLDRLRRDGLRVRVLEAGLGVGGTWYWNTYPGARVDIESMEYSYPFPEIQQEWSWPEKYSAQPDVERYLNWVADRLELRDDIEFGRTVTTARHNGRDNCWNLTARTDAGGESHYRARYLMLATGFLSVPNLPDIPGLEDFSGVLAHTARWPDGGVEVDDKRVGIIGTAASGVQVTQTVAPRAAQLTVFQRTANWCFPLMNVPMRDEYEAWVKANYDHIREQEFGTRGGTILVGDNIVLPNESSALDAGDQERQENFSLRWDAGGPHMGRSFGDLLTNEVANNYLREFWTAKIAQAVNDPEVARTLTPTHPPLTRRPPGTTGYYETFNRDNVDLVDISHDPIDRVLPQGIRLRSGATHDLDILVLATGFDAGGGAAMQIDLVGRDGLSIQDHWKHGVRTAFGMLIHRFPNLFLLNGPQSPSTFFSPPLLSVYQADFISRVIAMLDERPGSSIEATLEAEDDWTDQVQDIYAQTLIPQTDSWWMGANIPGKPRRPVAYAGGFPEYKRRVEESLKDYESYLIHHDTSERVAGDDNR